MQRRLWFWLLLLIIIFPSGVRAGFFSVVTNLFNGQDSDFPMQIQTIQNMSLLEAVDGNNPNFFGGNQIETSIVDGNSFLAEAGPAGGVADVASSSLTVSDQISIYTVHKGDTLSGIAEMFKVTPNTILWANNLKRGEAIHEGDTLVILPISGLQYTVRKGDTLASVAKKYGGDIEEIVLFNNLDSQKLTVGETIIIPNGEILASSVSASGTKKTTTQVGRPNYVGYFVWPVSGGRKSQGLHPNNAIDIAAPAGTQILASAGGTVILVKEIGYNGGYGNYAVIKHSNGTQTLYAHALYFNISVGQTVTKGQVIGAVGSTGRSTGNHLHFEVRGAKNPF